MRKSLILFALSVALLASSCATRSQIRSVEARQLEIERGLAQHRVASYYIMGEVRHSGRYPLDEKQTLLRAIASAGGFREHADVSKVKILRQNKPSTFDIRHITNAAQEDPVLEPDDVIIVPPPKQ